MNRFWKNFLALLVLIVVILAGAAWYMGAVSSYEVEVRTMGPYNFVYEEFTGPYEQSGPVFDRVYNDLLEDGIGTTVGMGLYYDNPDETSASELYSELGAVIDDIQAATLPEGYSVKVVDATEYAVVKFPYRNMLSYMIGPMVVYPVLNDYFGDQESSAEYAIELYMQDSIYYMIEISEIEVE